MEYEKDYSLLRPFDWAAAKRGDAICYTESAPAKYIAGPNRLGCVVVELDGGHYHIDSRDNLRMAPLAWVEGKPVYKGDVLYDMDYGTRQVVRCKGPSQTLETEQPRNDGSFIICIEDATWTPPKVKREGFVCIVKSPRDAVEGGCGDVIVCNCRIFPTHEAAQAWADQCGDVIAIAPVSWEDPAA